MSEVWTIARLVESMQKYFAGRGIDTARLDAELLLAQVLQKNRIYLYTHHDQPITDAERDAVRALAKRRAAYEPMAYIRGSQEFYGRDFAVGPAVLVPRPETEHLLERGLAYLQPLAGAVRVLDIGCGSGIIAISVALALPQAQVYACDISAAALDVARANAQTHGVADRVHFFEQDILALGTDGCATFLAAHGGAFDAVLSNPPYIAPEQKRQLPPDVVMHEPHVALFAEDDGCAILRHLCQLAPQLLAACGFFAVELGPEQAQGIYAQLQPFAGRSIDKDLAGRARIVSAWQGAWPAPQAQAAEEPVVPLAEATPEVPQSQEDDAELARD